MTKLNMNKSYKINKTQLMVFDIEEFKQTKIWSKLRFNDKVWGFIVNKHKTEARELES